MKASTINTYEKQIKDLILLMQAEAVQGLDVKDAVKASKAFKKALTFLLKNDEGEASETS